MYVCIGRVLPVIVKREANKNKRKETPHQVSTKGKKERKNKGRETRRRVTEEHREEEKGSEHQKGKRDGDERYKQAPHHVIDSFLISIGSLFRNLKK